MTPLDRLDATLRARADPTAAVAMRAYLRDQFEFLGLKAPAQRAVAREALAGTTFTEEVVGTLVARHPHLVSTMDEWIDEDNLWLIRTAILPYGPSAGARDETVAALHP